MARNPIIRENLPDVPTPTEEETPHGCYEGWVYMGFEGEDESGERVEEIERVPAAAAVPKPASPGRVPSGYDQGEGTTSLVGVFQSDRKQPERRGMYAVMEGERIKAMRQERGLSGQELAERVGIARETVARMERSERVRAKTAWRVARVFGLHPKEVGRPAR
jgi:DNA-binding XRE family transcriptional regulator